MKNWDGLEYYKQQARKILNLLGYVAEQFDGDFNDSFECYARPQDKPTSLWPRNEKEAELQAEYTIGGFPQDFTELFMFNIDETGKVTLDE